ncbi:MAG: SpoIIE family protein phosphatase [Burkholderiaceae bacterium]|nr:SpoIIE family protein phosphatase [Burkholderiaceae bacterium]
MKFLAHIPAPTALVIKRMLRVFLPTAVFICGCAFFIHQTEIQRQHAELASKEQEAIRAGAVSLNRTLQQVGRDLLYLSGRLQSRQLIDDPSAQNLARLSASWVTFSQANQVYNKIRWLDETGMERMRVDYAEPVPQIVEPAKLQYKGNRYFFIEINRLNANEIFVSPLDLNVDNNQIEVPYHPNIRFGMPVFNSQGERRGIMLINYSARNLLKRFESETGQRSNLQWLVNQEGYWLKGQSADDEFGFMFGRKELTMATRYPDAWREITASEKGQFETPEGLWTFATVYPLEEWQNQGSSTGGPKELAKVTANVAEGSKYAWKSVSLLPAAEYDAGLLTFRMKLGGGVLLLLALFFAGSLRMIQANVARERIQGELNVATDIQASLLPRTFPAFPHRPEFDIFASMDPAKEVGGDFYDFFFIDDTHLCFLIADVSDKGVPAALYMMVAKTLLKSEGQRLAEPAQILASVNNTLAADNDNCMFTTVLCAILNTATGEVRLANAGHNPPLLIDAAGVRYLHLQAGLVLGPMVDTGYQTERVWLNAGDTLFFYTDGVTEAKNPEDKLYGEDRLLKALQEGPKNDVTEMIHTIRAAVTRHANGAPQSDDVTMLAITYRG